MPAIFSFHTCCCISKFTRKRSPDWRLFKWKQLCRLFGISMAHSFNSPPPPPSPPPLLCPACFSRPPLVRSSSFIFIVFFFTISPLFYYFLSQRFLTRNLSVSMFVRCVCQVHTPG